jgi:GNAT superfamily N-acetyltransferase
MRIDVRRVEYQEIEELRGLYRQEANCQIIHDSCLRRGIADSYLILVDGRVGGYGGVWNKYDPDRLMEFYTLPHLRPQALPLYRELLAAASVGSVEAQTNIPLMLLMLYDCAVNIRAENVLFHDALTTHLPCPGGLFRAAVPQDNKEDAWVVEAEGAIVASGGFLCHYNPPYGDIYMSVEEGARRKGYGSYLVQELKRVCYEAGRKPSARCNANNLASRLTLQKAGMLPCGRLMVGDVRAAG